MKLRLLQLSKCYQVRFYCKNESLNFAVVSFYKFKNVTNPKNIVQNMKPRLSHIQAKGRVYLNSVGINSQICLPQDNLNEAKQIFEETYENINLRIHYSDFQVFRKLRVINKKLVDGIDDSFDCQKVGKHLSPKQWNQILDQNDQNTLLLDIRNKYEWEVGHFKGCEDQILEHFNEFDDYANDLAQNVDKDRKILMYCTGGIRCEVFSAKMKERGFKDVNQLEGGILNYGLDDNTQHWTGNLFVFDDRLVVPVDGNPDSDKNEVITKCHHCSKQGVQTYYNCANSKCNNVFSSCETCAVKFIGCCSKICSESDNNYIRRNSKQAIMKKSVGRGKHYRQALKKIVV